MTALPAKANLNDSNVTQGTFRTAIGNLRDFVAEMPGGSAQEALTIASGVVTPTSPLFAIDTEASASSDDLTTIAVTNHPSGRLVLLHAANGARTVVLKNNTGGTGKIMTLDGADVALDEANKYVMLWHDGGTGVWQEVFRSWGSQSTYGLSVMQAADAAAARLLLGEVLRRNWSDIFAIATGTNTVVVNPSVAIPSYTDRMPVLWEQGGGANTGSATINVSSKGAKALTKDGGAALKAGDLKANMSYIAVYNLSQDRFDLISPVNGQITQGKHTISMNGPSGINYSSNASPVVLTDYAPTAYCNYKGYPLDASVAEYVMFQIPMPKSWDEGTLEIEVIWSVGTTGTGNVVWDVYLSHQGDLDAPPTSWASNSNVTDAANGTAHAILFTSAISVAATGASQGDLINLRVGRSAADGSDTLAVDAIIRGIRVKYSVNEGNDA